MNVSVAGMFARPACSPGPLPVQHHHREERQEIQQERTETSPGKLQRFYTCVCINMK